MDAGPLVGLCTVCAHLTDAKQVGLQTWWSCHAFPDHPGIPPEFALGKAEHRTSVPGDNGIVYAPADEEAPR